MKNEKQNFLNLNLYSTICRVNDIIDFGNRIYNCKEVLLFSNNVWSSTQYDNNNAWYLNNNGNVNNNNKNNNYGVAPVLDI